MKTLLIVVGLLAGLLAAEAGLRLSRPDLALEAFKTPNWPKPEIFRPSRDLPYELEPNVPGTTNSHGMRDREYAPKKPTGVFRIAFLGDSVTMYSTFTDIVEESLQARFPGRFEVLNFAIGGHGLREYPIVLKRRAAEFEPDLVVLGVCLNDLEGTRVLYRDRSGRINAYAPLAASLTRLDNFLYPRFYAYRLLARLERDIPHAEKIERGEQALRSILAYAAKRAVPVRAVVFPYLKPKGAWLAQEREQLMTIELLLKRVGIRHRRLESSFLQRPAARASAGDTIHFSRAADERVAPLVEAFLADEGFIARPPAR